MEYSPCIGGRKAVSFEECGCGALGVEDGAMSEACVFCKIVNGELPAAKVYEDARFLVFKDIHPAAPVHWLAIPKRHIARLSQAEEGDRELLGDLMLAIGRVARDQGLEAYRMIINDGAGAGQTVFHLHAHILSGREFGERLV